MSPQGGSGSGGVGGLKTEHRLLLAMALSVMVIVAAQVIFPKPPVAPRNVEPHAAPVRVDPPRGGEENGGEEAGPAVPGPDGEEPATGAGKPGPAAVAEPEAAADIEIVSGHIHATVRARGASISKAWLKGIPTLPGTDPSTEEGAYRLMAEGRPDQPGALGVSVESRDFVQVPLDLESRIWTLTSLPGALPVVFETPVFAREPAPGRNVFIRKTITPSEDPAAFHLAVKLETWCTDPALEGQQMNLRVRGAALVPAPDEAARDILYGFVKIQKNADPMSVMGPAVAEAIREKDLEDIVFNGDIEWAATASTYFAVLLDPLDPPPGEVSPALEVRWEALTPPGKAGTPAVLPQPSPLVIVPGTVREKGATWTREFVLYGGPTAPEATLGGTKVPVLDRPEYEAYKAVRNPGWFDLIGQGLFFILKGFHALVGNWGTSIILLTVLVRGALMPLSRKQMRSTLEYSRKMAKIKPKLEAMKEKYRNNKQKQSQEQFRIMKENDVPLMPGGCLLTFLQFPIWIALYRMLQSNYELRHAPFLWVRDLSQADHLWHMLPGVAGIPLVPNALEWLNLLPLLMTASWFFASKATMTQPADEQQAQMQTMMKYMPFVMLLFPGFYTMPAGLCLYITASSAWGIIESRIVRKRFEDAKGAPAPATLPAAAAK